MRYETAETQLDEAPSRFDLFHSGEKPSDAVFDELHSTSTTLNLRMNALESPPFYGVVAEWFSDSRPRILPKKLD